MVGAPKGEPKRSTCPPPPRTDQAAGLFTLHPPPELDPTVSDTVKVKPLLPPPKQWGMQPLRTPAKLKLASFAGRLVVPPPGGHSPAHPPPSAGLASAS